MSGKSRRMKGILYEREIASEFREEGWGETVTFRSLRAGTQGHADLSVPELPRLHVECKAQQTNNIPKWIKQAVEEARPGQVPVIFWKRDRRKGGDVVILRKQDLWPILRDGAEALEVTDD